MRRVYNGVADFLLGFQMTMSLLQNLEPTAVKAFSIPSNPPPAVISDLKGIASYNWVVKQGVVSLAIPGKFSPRNWIICECLTFWIGSPRLWQNPRLPLRVPADSGTVFVDQNAAHCDNLNTSTLTPLFLAVDKALPAFDYAALDLVSNRNNMRKLLRWAGGTMEKAFRIDVELVGTKTMVFLRCEENTTETIAPGQFRGFGDTFKQAVTSTIVLNATGHHRAITYVRQSFPNRKPQTEFNYPEFGRTQRTSALQSRGLYTQRSRPCRCLQWN
jgi:hypothetical protein